jgi:hypothetical protein
MAVAKAGFPLPRVTWMKEPQTVSFADVRSVEARTADNGSTFGPLRLDA